jgi:hypothetical protein
MSPTQNKTTQLARRILLLITVIIIVAFPCFAQTKEKDDKYWALTQKYCNARFGFCVYHPASVGWRDQQGVWHAGNQGAEPENNDGSKFDNGNGLEMTVSGINNATNDTLASEMRTARDSFDRITYRAKGKNWFILKGLKKGATDTVVYLKTYIGRGSINHLRIEVPFPLRKGYSQVVSNIAGSFSPGRLSVPH